MKRENLDKYVGKSVEITMTDNDTAKGILKKGADFNAGWYQCDTGFWFRATHAKKILLEGTP